MVCQLDNEPLQAPPCPVQDQPHWSSWIDTGGAWTPVTGSYATRQLHNHEALGWRHVLPSASPSPPPAPQPL